MILDFHMQKSSLPFLYRKKRVCQWEMVFAIVLPTTYIDSVTSLNTTEEMPDSNTQNAVTSPQLTTCHLA